MSAENKHRICPVELAGALEISFRKLLQNPRRILGSYVKDGMTVLDLGCGPGFFTLEMARRVGERGKVTAADLQEGMLEKTRAKIKSKGFADRVKFHQCQSDRIGLSGRFDFILVFYMLHEVPDPVAFLRGVRSLLKPGGRVLLVEPNFHVSRSEFQEFVVIMEQAGFAVLAEPRVAFSRSVVLGNAAASAPGSRAGGPLPGPQGI